MHNRFAREIIYGLNQYNAAIRISRCPRNENPVLKAIIPENKRLRIRGDTVCLHNGNLTQDLEDVREAMRLLKAKK